MMLVVSGLPAHFKYHDAKAMIKQEAHVTDFILDNLVVDSAGINGTKKVTVGLADSNDAPVLMRRLTGFDILGNKLNVTAIGKNNAPLPPPWKEEKQQRGLSQPQKEARGFTQKAEPPWRSDKTSEHPQKGFNHAPEHQRGYNKPTETPRSFDQQTELQRGFNQQTTSGGFGKNPQGLQVENPKGFNQQAEPARGFGQPGGTERGYGRETEPPRAYGQQQMDQPGPDQYGYGPRHGSNASHGFPVDKTHEETRKSGQQMPDSGANPSRHSGQAPSTLGYRDHGSQAPKLRVQAEDRPYGQREFDPNSRPGFSGPSSIGFNPHGFLSVPPLKAELSKPPIFDRLGPQYNQPYESQISAQPFSAAPLKPPANRDFLGKPSKLPPPRQQSPTRINSPNRHLSPRRPPRHGLGRDSPPRQGQFEGSPSRQREPWLSPQRQGPLGSSPPHQGVPRRSPPRHGPLKMSPPRQASFRRSPLHQGQFRGSPPRLGVQRRTPPHQGPYRRSPPRERAPRGSPQRQGPFRGSPSRQGPFRGSPSRQGSFRGSPPLQGQFRRSPRRSPPRQMSFRGSSPRERAPRGSPQRQGPFRGSPSRQGPFRESPSRQGQFRESPPRLGVLRGSSPRQKPFRRSPPRQEPPRGSPQRHGLMRSSPPHQGQYRGSPPHQGYFRGSPPRQGPLRVSPSRQGPQVESMGIFERPRVHKLGPPKGRTAFETSPAHPSGNYPNEPYPAGGEDAYIPPPPWVDPQNELEPFHNRGPRFKEHGQEPSLENYGAVEVRKRPEETIKESSGGEKSRKPRGSRGRRNRSRSPPGPGGVPSWRPIGHSPGRHPDQRSTPPCSRTPHHRSRSPLRGRNRGQASPPPTWGGPEHRERSPSPGQVAPWAESVLHDMAPRTIRHPFVTKEPEFGRINDGGPPQGQPSHHRSPRHGSPGPYRDEDMLSRKLLPRFSDHSPLRSEPPMPHFENTGPYHPQDHPHMEEVHFHAREDIRYSEEYPPQEGGISPSYERPEPWLQENEALDMGHLPLEHIGFEASSSRRSPEKPRRIYLLPEQDRSVRMEVATIISKQIIGYFNPEPADDERFQKRLIFSMMKKIADRIDDIFHETVGIQFDGILRVYRQVYPEDEDAKLLGDCILTCKLNKIKNTRMVEGVLPTAAKRRAPSPVDRRGPPALAPPAEHHAPPPGKKPKQPKSHELTIPAIIAKATRPMKPGPSPLSTAPIPKYVQGDKKVYKEKQLLQKLEFSEQSLYQLEPLQRRELDSELDYIMSLAMTVLPQNPQKPTDARMVKSIKGPGGAEIRQVLDLHVTKRLLNIPSNLSVRIFGFPTLPSRQTLESFLKEFRAVSMKKSGNKRVYVATLPDYYHYDSICQLGTTELDGATIQIKPFHLTGPKLQHMQKFMKKQSREQTQVHPTFNPPKDAEESINKPPSTDTRGSTLIAQNEEIVAKSGTKSSQSGSKSSQSRGNITQPAGKSQPVGQSAQTGSKSSGGNPSQPGGKSSKPQGKHSQSEAGRYTNGGNSTKDSRAREESRDTGRAAYVVDEIGPSDNECGYIPFDDLEDY